MVVPVGLGLYKMCKLARVQRKKGKGSLISATEYSRNERRRSTFAESVLIGEAPTN